MISGEDDMGEGKLRRLVRNEVYSGWHIDYQEHIK